MKYISTQEAAEKWNISDRRVRVLCREGRIPGVVEERGAYLIPFDAEKPTDKRYRKAAAGRLRYKIEDGNGLSAAAEATQLQHFGKTVSYLKWEDEVIGEINEDWSVHFVRPHFNSVIEKYTHGENYWTRGQFEAFLQERIVSRDRRDIERILFRCGLSAYDVIKIGLVTRAVHAADLIWITDDPKQRMQDAISDVFNSVFMQKVDAEGDSIDTPEGFNIKRYGVYEGHYGIFKKRISPVTMDAEAEIAVSALAERMGIGCCRVDRVDEDTVFSRFEYDFSKEYIVHMRRIIEPGANRGDNEFLNLVSARPQYYKEIVQMIILDFVTRQDDRHLSNIAVKISDKGESFYPLYDNGRSLFYEDSEETAKRACKDIRTYSTSFGPSGTYYDHICDISKNGTVFGRLVDLEVSADEVESILDNAGFKGYRKEASVKWITKALAVLKDLDNAAVK